MTKEADEVAGTANKLRRAKLYCDLSEEYTLEGVNLLTSRDLSRNGVPMSPEGVGHWAIINRAAKLGQMDLAKERAIANSKTNALTDAILGRPVILYRPSQPKLSPPDWRRSMTTRTSKTFRRARGRTTGSTTTRPWLTTSERFKRIRTTEPS